MEVILSQDVAGVGKAGEAIKVKDGFAHNFLFPKQLAVPVTAANLKKLEQEKNLRSSRLEKEKKEAQDLKDKLAGISLTIAVLTQEEDKLYASIGRTEIHRALSDEGYTIDKNAIIIEEPIKSLGIYQVPVKLHPEVLAEVKIWIVKK
jgi:large subunit ribosomal protein L9